MKSINLHNFNILKFEFLKSVMWFTILPVSSMVQKCIPKVNEEEKKNIFNINVFQYKYLPYIGLIKISISIFIGVLISHFYNNYLAAILASIIYVFISGLIHLDAFLDTIDALFYNLSNKENKFKREKILSVMREPHVGALGVSWLFIYFALTVTLLSYCFLYINETKSTSLFILLFTVFFLSKLNCLRILLLTYEHNKFIPDSGIKLEFGNLFPPYSKEANFSQNEKIKSLKGYINLSLLFFFSSCSIFSLSMNNWDFKPLILLLGMFGLFEINGFFNRSRILKISRHFGFLNGDMLGFSICLYELSSLVLLTLIGTKLFV